jgi:hypothetical protein
MGQVNLTSVDNAYKTYFQPGRVERIGYEEQPTVAWLPKSEDFYGRNCQFDVAYEATPGASADFQTALANAGVGSYATFTLNRARYYSIVNLDNESMEAAGNDDGAFVDLKKEEVETSIKVTTEKLGNAIFRNHGGAIGRANGLAGSVLTLTNPDDIVNFKKGQKLRSATTDGTSGSVKTGVATVTAVDRQNGKVTADWTSISGFVGTASGDYVFPDGDFGNGVRGFDSYIPVTAPTAGDSVFTFDRSVDSRLSGMRYDGSSLTISDAILKGLAQFRREGGSGAIDMVTMNYDRFTDLSLDLGAKATRDESGKTSFGYDTIKVSAGGRPVTIMGDHNCQPDTAWCLTKRTWLWKGLGKTPRFFIQNNGGQNFIVDPTADGVQIRSGWRGNLLCKAPGLNGRITLPTV